jgi:hypothetical protein
MGSRRSSDGALPLARRFSTAQRIAIPILLIAMLTCRATAQQSPTLRDQVRANNGKPVSILVRRDAGPVPIETLAKADLVVRGKLRNPKSYLSEDGHHIYTDYELIPIQMVSDRAGLRMQARSRQRITVTLYGGELVIDGTMVSVTDGSRDSWSEGADLLLFLIRNSRDGAVYQFEVGGPGMFEVKGDHVKALRTQRDRDPEIEGVPFEQLVQTIHAHAKQ